MIEAKNIIVALDYNNYEEVLKFIDNIDPNLFRLKIGKELFTKYGPSTVKEIHNKGFEVFLDLKFHDIPTTVKRACYVASELGVWMLNVHAMGGNDMLSAAKEGVDQSNQNPYLIGVTVLTSMNNDNLNEIVNLSRQYRMTLRNNSMGFLL